jgi:hypothetical protein
MRGKGPYPTVMTVMTVMKPAPTCTNAVAAGSRDRHADRHDRHADRHGKTAGQEGCMTQMTVMTVECTQSLAVASGTSVPPSNVGDEVEAMFCVDRIRVASNPILIGVASNSDPSNVSAR